MYNNGFGSPEPTNNPFVNDPRNPQTRFPDISSTITGSQTQWTQTQPDPSQFGQWQQNHGIYQQPLYQQSQQPQLSPGYASPSGYSNPSLSNGMAPQSTGMPYQPTSSFGKHLAASMSGSYGYLPDRNSQPQSQGYNPAQQPSYLSQFDPYSSIGQGWSGEAQPSPQAQNTQSPTAPISTPTTTSSSGHPHPREWLRSHKAEIEAWETYAWKQLLSAFGGLKEAWSSRAQELNGKINELQTQLQYGGYYTGQIQQEIARLQALHKEAQSHVDTVAASSFQMEEVFQGYRQSSDLASKRRVREASNAALQALPDWPPSVY